MGGLQRGASSRSGIIDTILSADAGNGVHLDPEYAAIPFDSPLARFARKAVRSAINRASTRAALLLHMKSSLQINDRKPAGGPRTVEGKARSLANLRKFQPGQSGNPAGRPKNVGLSQLELMNELSAEGLTTDELRAIAGDPSKPHSLCVAAERLVAQRHSDEPLAREATKLVFDYTSRCASRSLPR